MEGLWRLGGAAPSGRPGQRPRERCPGARQLLERLRARHRRLHERHGARADLRDRLPGLRRCLTGKNWNLPLGYGTLVAASLPSSTTLRLATCAERIDVTADGVAVTTRAGTVRAGAAILTVSTAVLAGDAIRLPPGTEPWREAAAALPLGRHEKLFLEIGRDTAFGPDAHAYGDLRDPKSASYSIRPNGWLIIEAFLGGDGARILEEGPAAGFAYVSAQLVGLFGSEVASAIRPLAATSWSRMASIGGAYSCALPGQSKARARLAQPFEERLFFAGEATHQHDFTTAHGAHDSGQRAADEAMAALAGRQRIGRRGPLAAAGARAAE